MKTFIVESKARLDQYDNLLSGLEKHITHMSSTIKSLETQMGQLASIVKENLATKFPTDTQKNPKECMAVTLRSGKELEIRQPKGLVLEEKGTQTI